MKNDIATTSSAKKRLLNTPPTGDLKAPAPRITLVDGGDAFEFVELLQKINKFNHPQLSCRFSRLAE